jgi:hypothetical protein
MLVPQDFEAIAELVRHARSEFPVREYDSSVEALDAFADDLARLLADHLDDTTVRFDRRGFLTMCGMSRQSWEEVKA